MITKIRTNENSQNRNTSRRFLAVMTAALISTTMFVPLAQAGSTDGLAANWKFDETSGLTAADSSGNNTAVLMNGPAWSAGRTGNALSFDGADDHV